MVKARPLRLRYTRSALADLSAILDYIAERSPQGASLVQARIHAVIDLLRRFPRAGARTEDPTVRRFVASPYPYLVFYEADREGITIHAVRHAARDPATNPVRRE